MWGPGNKIWVGNITHLKLGRNTPLRNITEESNVFARSYAAFSEVRSGIPDPVIFAPPTRVLRNMKVAECSHHEINLGTTTNSEAIVMLPRGTPKLR